MSAQNEGKERYLLVNMTTVRLPNCFIRNEVWVTANADVALHPEQVHAPPPSPPVRPTAPEHPPQDSSGYICSTTRSYCFLARYREDNVAAAVSVYEIPRPNSKSSNFSYTEIDPEGSRLDRELLRKVPQLGRLRLSHIILAMIDSYVSFIHLLDNYVVIYLFFTKARV